jgi:hypothetical protein
VVVFGTLVPLSGLYDVNDNFVVKTMTDIKFPSNAILKTGQNGIKLEPEQRERLGTTSF